MMCLGNVMQCVVTPNALRAVRSYLGTQAAMVSCSRSDPHFLSYFAGETTPYYFRCQIVDVEEITRFPGNLNATVERPRY